MSYLERSLWWYIKNRIFGGLQKLKQRKYLPFAVITVIIMPTNTILLLLSNIGIINSPELVQNMLVLELFISFGFIVSGISGVGRLKRNVTYFLSAGIIIAFFLAVFIIFDWSSECTFFQFIKLIFFITWVSISCFSYFFMNLYFFTSLPKKFITWGAPKNHILFGPFLKTIILVSLPIFGYIIYTYSQYNPDLGSLVMGVLGIIAAIIVLSLIVKIPKKVDSLPENSGKISGLMNFTTAIGFFYVFILYQLILSFTPSSQSIGTLISEIFLLLIGLLFVIQNITARISLTTEIPKKFENPIRFQSKLLFTSRLKKLIGEPGLVLVVMGIVIGYHMVYLDSFSSPKIMILSYLTTPELKMSAVFHRIYVIFSFIIILIFCSIFSKSDKFKEFMNDKFTISQVIKFIETYFQKSTDNLPSLFEYDIIKWGKQIGDKIGNKIEEGLKGLGQIADLVKKGFDNKNRDGKKEINDAN
ncbi:MAG: hypothetical protein ACTSWY_03335 [Promethearchaeota archaeon]